MLGAEHLLRLRASGTEFTSASVLPRVAQSLAGKDPHELCKAMEHEDVQGLLVGRSTNPEAGEDATVAERLAAYGYVPGLRAVVLAPEAALYVGDPLQQLSQGSRRALAGVARGLLKGLRPPRIASFPEPLRRVRNLEVMVMLRHRGTPRLWRSARGSSIARASITASVTARRRWAEREHSMGGSLDRLLPELDVEVSLLQEDGTLAVRHVGFVNRVFTPAHGVAYERAGAWRYFLPEATRKWGGDIAVKAYEKLFADDDMSPDSLQRDDLRLYRLVVIELARSPAASAD